MTNLYRRGYSVYSPKTLLALTLGLAGFLAGPEARGQCTLQPTLQNYTGGIVSVCPCFVPGEEAAAIFNPPAGDFPIKILKVGIGWASQFGGTGQQLESGIHVYGAGLPNPGPRLYTLAGPILTDGFINEFNLDAQLGNVYLSSRPFTISLEFLNESSIFGPAIGMDSGCQPGKNAVHANPGGWSDACGLGVPGDWVIYVIYNAHCGPSGVGEEHIASNVPAVLMNPRPNPIRGATSLEFFLAQDGKATLSVFDVAGRQVARIAEQEYTSGTHTATWDGSGDDGERLAPGTYFLELRAGTYRTVQKVVMAG